MSNEPPSPPDHPLVRLHTPSRKGVFRRGIMLRRVDPNMSYGWVEDDFHHFGVRIVHRDGVITDVSARAERAPWSSCPAAAVPLLALKDKPLQARASDIGALIDMRLQCTHMFDLAGLVMAQAVRGKPERRYLVEVPPRPIVFGDSGVRQIGPVRVTLTQDGSPAMIWDLDGDDIVGPEPYGRHSLNRGFRAWTESMPLEEAEQAFVLRRAIMVSSGRLLNLDLTSNAAEAPLPPVCHTFQGRLEEARRMVGSTRDYSASPAELLWNADVIP